MNRNRLIEHSSFIRRLPYVGCYKETKRINKWKTPLPCIVDKTMVTHISARKNKISNMKLSMKMAQTRHYTSPAWSKRNFKQPTRISMCHIPPERQPQTSPCIQRKETARPTRGMSILKNLQFFHLSYYFFVRFPCSSLFHNTSFVVKFA